jgi:hypothetical protein
MFCPKCGCILPDNAIFCKECGYSISGKVRSSLKEEQPQSGISRIKMTSDVKKYMAMRIVGCICALIAVLSIFMYWGVLHSDSGTVYYSASMIVNKTDTGWRNDAMAYVKYIPSIIPILGFLALVEFLVGGRGWSGTIAIMTGILIVLLSFMFCLELNNSPTVIVPGIAPYLCIVMGVTIVMTGSYCITPKMT